MTAPQDVTAAVDRLRIALEGMAAALASGELPVLLAAQDALLAAHIPSATLRGWTEEARSELRTALRRARASLNGCRRTNHILRKVVDDVLAGADVDYTRQGSRAPAASVTGETRLSCRV